MPCMPETLIATPTNNSLPLKSGDFETLSDALNYAGGGQTGCNFYSGRGKLAHVLSYSDLREQAQRLAKRLNSLGLPRGSRAALIADTTPDFLRFFFACQY